MPEGKRPSPNALVRGAVSGFLALLVLSLYITRPEGLQALHWWPMALWTPVVFLPFLSFRPLTLVRPFGMALLLWTTMLHLVREPSALVLLPPHAKAPGDLRIVSLNCAGGSVDAAREALAQNAEIVLLQEVASRSEFIEAGAEAGYSFVSWSVDDAVFSRSPITRPAKAMDFAAGTVEIRGQRIRVVALRLLPPVFRLDLWNPDCWREYAADAAARRARLKALLTEANVSGPSLIGGDFNATNPRLVTDSHPDLTEAGRAAGRGWRGTGTNDFPVVWVDQIWASPEFRWTQAYAQKTQNSDHRMLVADFRLAL